MSRVHTPITDEMADYIRTSPCASRTSLRHQREATDNHPQASMQTAPEQGQFLQSAGTPDRRKEDARDRRLHGLQLHLGGAGAAAGGKIIACDVQRGVHRRARGRRWREAGVEDKIELRLRPALETLDALIAEGQAGTFDFAFIDADKSNYSNYYERALMLMRTGGLIAIDNVLWHGDVIDPAR